MKVTRRRRRRGFFVSYAAFLYWLVGGSFGLIFVAFFDFHYRG